MLGWIQKCGCLYAYIFRSALGALKKTSFTLNRDSNAVNSWKHRIQTVKSLSNKLQEYRNAVRNKNPNSGTHPTADTQREGEDERGSDDVLTESICEPHHQHAKGGNFDIRFSARRARSNFHGRLLLLSIIHSY